MVTHRGRARLFGEVTIRFLLQLLLALVFAVTLAAASYALLLAVRHVPVGAGTAASLSRLPTLPEPSRLPRRPSFAPASSPTERAPFPAPVRPLAIEVSDLPAQWLSTAGIAVFDELDMRCAWLPLAAAIQGGSSTVHATIEVPANVKLRVTVANAEAHARHAYWLSVPVAADLRTDATVALRVPVQEVVVHAAGVAKPLANALRLRRTDDAAWTPTAAFAEQPTADRRGDVHLLLGPGSYVLAPWTDGPWPPLALTVPGPSEVTAAFAR